jgi:O-antigen ligase
MALKIITYLIVFLFPVLANLVEHAGSTVLTSLVILGVLAWMTRAARPAFGKPEKIVLWSFAVYFLVTLCFYIGHSFSKENFSLFQELSHWELRHEVRMLSMLPILYLLHRTGLKRWVLWYGAALAALLSGAYGIFDIYVLSKEMFTMAKLSEVPRAAGSYHPIAFGDLSLVLGFISLSGIRYFREKHKILTCIPVIALLGGMLACFLSGTRIAFIAIPFLALVCFFQLGAFKHPWIFRSLMVSAVLVFSVIFYHLPKSPLEHRLNAGIADAKSFFEGKDAGRYAVHLGMWAEGWKVFSDHPIAGVGSKGYKQIVRQKAADGQIPSEIGKLSTPHNMYLANMAAFGISGLIILLGIFISPLVVFFPAARKSGPGQDIAYAGFMLITGFMLFGLTECIFLRNINISFYIIMLAAIMTLVKEFEIQNTRGHS